MPWFVYPEQSNHAFRRHDFYWMTTFEWAPQNVSSKNLRGAKVKTLSQLSESKEWSRHADAIKNKRIKITMHPGLSTNLQKLWSSPTQIHGLNRFSWPPQNNVSNAMAFSKTIPIWSFLLPSTPDVFNCCQISAHRQWLKSKDINHVPDNMLSLERTTRLRSILSKHPCILWKSGEDQKTEEYSLQTSMYSMDALHKWLSLSFKGHAGPY